MESEYLITQYKKLYEETQDQLIEAEHQKAEAQNREMEVERQKEDAIILLVTTLHDIGKSPKEISTLAGITIEVVQQILSDK